MLLKISDTFSMIKLYHNTRAFSRKGGNLFRYVLKKNKMYDKIIIPMLYNLIHD